MDMYRSNYMIISNEFIDEEVEYLIFRCRCTMFKKSIREIEKSIDDLKHSNLIIQQKLNTNLAKKMKILKDLIKKFLL